MGGGVSQSPEHPHSSLGVRYDGDVPAEFEVAGEGVVVDGDVPPEGFGEGVVECVVEAEGFGFFLGPLLSCHVAAEVVVLELGEEVVVEGAWWGGLTHEVGPGGEGGAVALDAFGYGLLVVGRAGCSGVSVVGV